MALYAAIASYQLFFLLIQSSSHKTSEACPEVVIDWFGCAMPPLPFLLLVSYEPHITIHTSIHNVAALIPLHLAIAAFVSEFRFITPFLW